MCYDDLANASYKTGAGLLVECTNNKYMLIRILKSLIEAVFLFDDKYGDLTSNASKSCILRFGKRRKPAVSVCAISVTEH